MAGGGMGMGLQRNQSMYPGGPTPFNRPPMQFGMGRQNPNAAFNRSQFPGMGGGMSLGQPRMSTPFYQNSPTPPVQTGNAGGMSQPPVDHFPAPPPPTYGSGVTDAQGNVYAGRESTPRAYTAGAFNPNGGQWAQYGNPNGAPFAQTINGTNYLNGVPWDPEMNNTGGPSFSNFVSHYQPIWEAQQRGTYQPQYAGTGPNTDPSLYAGPGGTMPGSPGVGTPPPSSGITRPPGTPPPFDPRLTMSSGIDPATGLPFSRSNPYLK